MHQSSRTMLPFSERFLPAERCGEDGAQGEGHHSAVSEGSASESGGRRNGRHRQNWNVRLLLGLPQQSQPECRWTQAGNAAS